MRWKINSRGTKSRAKVKLVSFFLLPSPPCLVSMRLSEINRKSIVEVSLMNGLYITTYVLSDWRFVGLMGKVWPDSLAKCVSESETILYGRHCWNKIFLPDSFYTLTCQEYSFPSANTFTSRRVEFNTLIKSSLKDTAFPLPFLFIWRG